MQDSSQKVIGNGQYSFQLNSVLGCGKFGKVYLGSDNVNKTKVAVKMIPKSLLKGDKYMLNLLNQEIQTMKQVQSDHIVHLIDVQQTQNNYYIIQEYCNGGDLKKLLIKDKKISESEAVSILKQILIGMQELLHHQIIHRDLKPENILINNGIFKIGDFGFARFIPNQTNTLISQVGSPLYMSPQIMKNQHYTNKNDIWSLGVIFYEMLFGKTPWNNCFSMDQLYQKIVREPNLQFPSYISQNCKNYITASLRIEENKRISWNEVYQHPLFDNYFSNQKQIQQQQQQPQQLQQQPQQLQQQPQQLQQQPQQLQQQPQQKQQQQQQQQQQQVGQKTQKQPQQQQYPQKSQTQQQQQLPLNQTNMNVHEEKRNTSYIKISNEEINSSLLQKENDLEQNHSKLQNQNYLIKQNSEKPHTNNNPEKIMRYIPIEQKNIQKGKGSEQSNYNKSSNNLKLNRNDYINKQKTKGSKDDLQQNTKNNKFYDYNVLKDLKRSRSLGGNEEVIVAQPEDNGFQNQDFNYEAFIEEEKRMQQELQQAEQSKKEVQPYQQQQQINYYQQQQQQQQQQQLIPGYQPPVQKSSRPQQDQNLFKTIQHPKLPNNYCPGQPFYQPPYYNMQNQYQTQYPPSQNQGYQYQNTAQNGYPQRFNGFNAPYQQPVRNNSFKHQYHPPSYI